MKRPLLLLLLPLAALPGCKATLGPGEAWYTYRNPQNNFASVAIDGRTVGAILRPGDEGAYPLSMSRPHTVVVSRGTYKQIFSDLDDDFHERWNLDSIDPPFTITWSDQAGGWTVQSDRR